MSTFTAYRLRGIPASFDRLDTVTHLSRALSDTGMADICIGSLAKTQSSTGPETGTATLTFSQTPALIANPQQDEWSIKIAGFSDPLILDRHFLGMTKLHNAEDNEFQCNIIAVSGLASHPFGSWQPSGDKSFMWIRDALPGDMPKARVFLYGYDTTLIGSTSFQSITDLGLRLIEELRASVLTTPYDKPTIFLAHSLGGIVVKHAIVELANRSRLNILKGNIFFGVPSLGMTTSHLLAMIDGQPTESLVRSLSTDSEDLRALDDQFSGICSAWRIKTFWAYETQTSATVQVTNGSFARSGPQAVLVAKESATRNLYGKDMEAIFPINKNHRDIVKFSRQDGTYKMVLEKLRVILEQSDNAIPGLDPRVPTSFSGTLEHTSRSLQLVSPGYKAQEWEDTQRDSRFETIQQNSETTLEWIYDKDICPQFTTWLKSDGRIFWIHGKPGSGKSTLLKFIWEDKRTWQYIHNWKRNVEIRASFFFYHRGSPLQKSYEGFLRSLLYQILRQHPSFEKTIQAAHPMPHGCRNITWEIHQLEKALKAVLAQKEEQVDLFLFFDALDEYDGPPGFIAQFVRDLATDTVAPANRVKICFSSRPWSSFADEFQDDPSLQLQDFTKDDIRVYCDKTINSSEILAQSEEVDLWTSIVISRAEGVFLWVNLVLRDLCQEAEKGRAGDDLTKILSDLPTDLDEYYTLIISRIDHLARWDAYVILETLATITMAAEDMLIALNCSRCQTFQEIVQQVDNTNKDFNLRSSPGSFLDTALSCNPRLIGEIGRLRDRCGGLIEWSTDKDATEVQLIHQSVRDFIRKEGFQELVLGKSRTKVKENGFSFLAKISLYWYIPPYHPSHFFYHAEQTTGTSMKLFLDSVAKTPNSPRIKTKCRGLFVSSAADFDPVEFSVWALLSLYLTDALRKNP
ncbi:hypothetical protein GQ53DRAFT_714083, partial [Thozetella sp. PMI_491]